MFFPGSRYEKSAIYQVTAPDGRIVNAVEPPLPAADPLLGFHPRKQGQRLDLIANFYLKDATRFWRICDANGALAPAALETHGLIGIPEKA